VHLHRLHRGLDAAERGDVSRDVGVLCKASKGSAPLPLHNHVGAVCPHGRQDVTDAHRGLLLDGAVGVLGKAPKGRAPLTLHHRVGGVSAHGPEDVVHALQASDFDRVVGVLREVAEGAAHASLRLGV